MVSLKLLGPSKRSRPAEAGTTNPEARSRSAAPYFRNNSTVHPDRAPLLGSALPMNLCLAQSELYEKVGHMTHFFRTTQMLWIKGLWWRVAGLALERSMRTIRKCGCRGHERRRLE